MNIYFYNHYHNGDLHLSREIVKYLLDNLEHQTSFYISNCDANIFYDLPVIPIGFDNYHFLNQNSRIFMNREDLFINTWIGQSNRFFLDRKNAFCVSASANLKLLKSITDNLSIGCKIDERGLVPRINFNSLDSKNKIDNFFITKKNNILFCNNFPKSNQAASDDLSFLLNYLSKQFPNINFIVTNKQNEIAKFENIYYSEEICLKSKNLIDISYMSTKCDVIFGRASGPYEFCKISDNIFEKEKKFICFSREVGDASWIDPIYCECSFEWSNDLNNIKKFLEEECRKLSI